MEQLSGTARFWHWWAACSLRRAVLVALLGTLALVASAPFAARLYGDLRTDLRELLPQGAPAAVALAELEKRIGGLSHLAIVVRTDDLKAGERFVDALAKSLKQLPPSLVAQVHWRVDAEKEFLDRHGALYADLKDLTEAQEALVRDLALSSALTLAAVGLALILYYRTVRAVPLLTIPLFTGVALTFALSREVIHYLNPNTAFLGSIIIGNGINAGIILLARYIEERRHGSDIARALPLSLRATWIATFAASGAPAAAHRSAGAGSFRGVNPIALLGLFRVAPS